MKRRLAAVLRFLRGDSFWKVVLSLAFIFGMTFLPRVPFGQGDEDDPDDDTPPAHVSPFEAGFIAACALGAFWTFYYKRQHPKFRGNIRAPVWDLEAGQFVAPSFCFTEGNRWPWIACLRETGTGDMHMLELEAETRGNDLGYDEDIHIVPCKLNEDGPLDSHDFTRSCHCIPVIMEQLRGRTLIIHREDEHRLPLSVALAPESADSRSVAQ